MTRMVLFVFSLLMPLSALAQGRPRVGLDCDTANEIDDLDAIAMKKRFWQAVGG